MRRFKIHTFATEDGWMAEVYCRKTGRTLYATRVHPSERDSEIDAMYWAENAALTK